MTTKFRSKPDDVVIAVEAATAELPEGVFTVRRGQRLRGDHPLVKHMGERGFVLDGTPESDWPTSFGQTIAAGEREAAKASAPPAGRIAPDTRAEDLMVATTGILSSEFGSCALGEIRVKGDPILDLDGGQYFQPLIEVARV
jgi:hypothetical protein